MSTPSSPGPREVEIKLGLTPDLLARLETHPALQPADGAAPAPRQETTTYFDTPDGLLDRAGLSLRIRRRGDERVQTLKRRGEAAGPFDRGEWEWTVAEDRPEPRLLAETPAAALLRDAPPLAPVFATEITRVTRLLRRDGACIEAALDRGAVRSGAAAEPVCELELELKDGPALPLYQLAETLHAEFPMALGAESKADRGWRLRTGCPRPARKQGRIALPQDVTAEAAFRGIVQATLASLMANQPAAAAGTVEGVHQMRIAIRRLRAALVLFRPSLEPHAEARFTAELRRLGQALGEPRDWDVFVAETLPAAAVDGVAEPWLALLRAEAEQARATAHARLEAELRGPALTALVLGLAAWAEDPRALAAAGKDLHAPVAELAASLEGRLEHKVLRRGRAVGQLGGEELHALRKSLKKLRYGVEFLAPVQRQKRVKAYLQGCKGLLKRLGAINDAAVATTLAGQLGGERQAELAPALAALANWAGRQRDAALAGLPKAWRSFKAARLPA